MANAFLQDLPRLTEYAQQTGVDEGVLRAVLLDKGILTQVVGDRFPGLTAAPTPTPTVTPAPTTTAPKSDMDDLIEALTIVRPGDLITATLFNTMVRATVGLHKRMLVLEKGDRTPTPAPAPNSTPAPPPTRVPVERNPKITSAAFQKAASGRSAVSILGTDLADVERIEINGVEVAADQLTVRDKTIEFTFPGGEEDLRGADIRVFGKNGDDTRVLNPATGKRLETLNLLIRNTGR